MMLAINEIFGFNPAEEAATWGDRGGSERYGVEGGRPGGQMG